MRHHVDTSICLPLPSGGSRGRSLQEPCGSPPSSVLRACKTAWLPITAASGCPWLQLTSVEGLFRFHRSIPSCPDRPGSFGLGRTLDPFFTEEIVSSPGFTGDPFENMPWSSTPATPDALA